MGVYKITSPIGRIYIGQSIDIEGRWKRYLRLGCKKQTKLYRSFLKYGVENHTLEIIEECIKEHLNDREEYWGIFYNVLNGEHLNLSLRGVNQIVSPETREKLRIANTGKPSPMLGKKHKEESKLLISESNLGKTHSLESRQKMSISQKGHKGTPHTPESKMKLSIANKGKNTGPMSEDRKKNLFNRKGIPHKQETKDKISAKNMGRTTGMHGKKHKEESKQKIAKSHIGIKPNIDTKIKMRLAKIKSVIQYDINMNKIREWDSSDLVFCELGIPRWSIGKCANNKQKTAGGFIWKYKDNKTI